MRIASACALDLMNMLMRPTTYKQRMIIQNYITDSQLNESLIIILLGPYAGLGKGGL